MGTEDNGRRGEHEDEQRQQMSGLDAVESK